MCDLQKLIEQNYKISSFVQIEQLLKNNDPDHWLFMISDLNEFSPPAVGEGEAFILDCPYTSLCRQVKTKSLTLYIIFWNMLCSLLPTKYFTVNLS